jgi:hypothetical protein
VRELFVIEVLLGDNWRVAHDTFGDRLILAERHDATTLTDEGLAGLRGILGPGQRSASDFRIAHFVRVEKGTP